MVNLHMLFIYMGDFTLKFYDGVKYYATRQNKSIREIERAVGLSSGSIGKWNESEPKVLAFSAVANYLGVPIDELLKSSEQ